MSGKNYEIWYFADTINKLSGPIISEGQSKHLLNPNLCGKLRIKMTFGGKQIPVETPLTMVNDGSYSSNQGHKFCSSRLLSPILFT